MAPSVCMQAEIRTELRVMLRLETPENEESLRATVDKFAGALDRNATDARQAISRAWGKWKRAMNG